MSFISSLRLPELRKKIIFTLVILFIYRIGSHIPIPGIDRQLVETIFQNNSMLSFLNLFSGGSLSRFSVFSLGILPYINASIIFQLLIIISPQLKELSDEGEPGRKRITQYTRLLTFLLAIIQSFVMTFSFKSLILPDISFTFFLFYCVASLTAGAILVMWLSELVTSYGIGNGASILIFIGIIAEIPLYFLNTITLIHSGVSTFNVILLFFSFFLIILAIVYVQEAERKVPIRYTRSSSLIRKASIANNSYLPLKLIQGGVMPIIFASAVIQFPQFLSQLLNIDSISQFISHYYHYQSILYNALLCFLIFFFTYFYTAITFNPDEISDNICKYGGVIDGQRPGKSSSDYLENILTTLTLFGAIFLALLALIPTIMATLTSITTFLGLGGTALLILVGVSLDLLKQIDAIIISHQYDQLSA